MLAVSIPVLGHALLDSLNPSALAMTLYLPNTKEPTPKLTSYLASVFATSLTVGLLLLLGLGTAAESPIVYAAQGITGAGRLLYTILAASAGCTVLEQILRYRSGRQRKARISPSILGTARNPAHA